MADTAQAVTQDQWDYGPPKVPVAVKPPAASVPATPSNQDEWDYGPAKAATPKAAAPSASPESGEWEYHSPAQASLPGATPRLGAMVDAGKVPGAQTEPTQVEKNVTPEPTWGSAAKTTAKNLFSGMVKFARRVLTPTPNNPDQLTKTGEDVARELPEAQERIATQQADVAAEKQAMGERKVEGYNPLYRVLAPFVDETGLVPINARQMEEQSRRGQSRQIATDASGGALLTASPILTKGAIKAGSYGWQQVGRPMTEAVTETAGAMVPERVKNAAQNLGIAAPPPAKSLTQALQPGVNIPRAAESFEIGGPRLQNVAQRMGEEITEPAHLIPGAKVMQAAKSGIWDAVEQRIGPLDDRLADTTDVANAMKEAIPDRIREQYPDLAARLDKRAETYIGQKSLRQLENNIESANNDLRGLYSRPNITDSPVSADAAVTKAEVEANRALLDRKVEELSGNEDVSTLKREYGALRDIEKAAARANRVVARQKGLPLYEGLAALSAAGDLVSGNLLGAARGVFKIGVGRYLQRLRDPNYLVDQAFQGSNAFKPAADIPPANPPIPYDPEQGTRVNLAPERTVGASAEPKQLTEGRTLITPAPADRSGPIPQEERIPMPGWATPAGERSVATPMQRQQVSPEKTGPAIESSARPVARPLSKLPSGVKEIPAAKPLSRVKPLGLSQVEIRQSISEIQGMGQDKLDYLAETKESQRAPEQIREAAEKRWEELTGKREPKSGPVAERFPKDAIEYAEGQMRGAVDLSNSIGRPGRYHSDLSELGASAREQDKAWYGIPAQKENIAGQFPWFNDPEISTARVANALKRGPGSANYEYIVGKILASEKK